MANLAASHSQTVPLQDVVREVDANGSLPRQWRTMYLRELATVKGGKRLPKGADFAPEATTFPYIRIVDFADGSVKADDLRYLTPEVQRHISRYVIRKNDVYISIAGTIGLAGTIPATLDGANLTENAARLIIHNSTCLSSSFLSLYLQSGPGQAQIESLTTKTTQPKLALARIEQIRVPVPTLPEQRAISRSLHAVQDAIQACRREMELERERKSALMQRLFTQGTRGEPTKQTEIGEMPESWQVVQLGPEAELITKGSSPNWQGFDYQEEGIVFVRSQNVGWGRLELDDIAHLPEAFNRKEHKSILQLGDLLINIVGASIGRASLADERVVGGNINQAVAIVRLRQRLWSGFVLNFLFTQPGQSQQHRMEKDIARANLSLQDITNLWIPMPSTGEQQNITETLAACDIKILAIEREIALHQELFRALLEELMTGRLSALPLFGATAEAEVSA